MKERLKEARCGNCKHGSEWITKKDAKLPGMGGMRTGFVRCAVSELRMVTYFNEGLPCQFAPSRYERRTDQQQGAQEGEGHGG